MKNILFLLFALALFAGCNKIETSKLNSYPDTEFITLSDLHYYDTTLGTTGSAFQTYLNNDRKLLAESPEIISAISEKVILSDAKFIIISGDLTKDGEKSSHLKVAQILKKIENSGKKVYIINGNHDILNPEAVSFSGNKTSPCPNITPSDFTKIYSDFGYSESLMKDSSSLSYVAEPVSNLWLLMIDSCHYNIKNKESVTEGDIKKETLSWIKSVINKASSENKSIIAVMHHGVIEHYPSNKKHYPQYILKNSSEISDLFIKAGVKLAFTGHYHAQDATMKKNKNGFLLDIETGSPLTYPCPYRVIKLKNNIVSSTSFFIDKISSNPDFKKYAEKFTYNGSAILSTNALKKYGANEKEISILVPQIAKAYTTHLQGDEIKPASSLNLKNLRFIPSLILKYKKSLIEGWYTDLPPSDNNFKVNLSTGTELK